MNYVIDFWAVMFIAVIASLVVYDLFEEPSLRNFRRLISVILFSALALGVLGQCKAETIVGVHTVSHHLSHEDDPNNQNFGVYVMHDGWTAGVYRNTIRRTSIYAGYTWTRGPVSLSVGAVSGYQRLYGQDQCAPGLISTVDAPCYSGVFSSHALAPMLVPSIKLGPARIWYMPRVGDSSSVIHLSLEREFK